MDFKLSLTIGRPVDEVFAFLADFTHLPLWNYYVLETVQLSPGPVGVGKLYRQRRKTDVQQFRVIEYAPGQAVAIQLIPPTLPVSIRFSVQAVARGTELTDEWKLWPRVPIPKAIARRITTPIARAVGENLSKLKVLLETGSVVLQDGRVVNR
jgi:uncharacterized protein YndB with AHSA1/START domain